MLLRLAFAGLVVLGIASAALGHHRFAFEVLVLAIPVVAAIGFHSVAELVEGRGGAGRAMAALVSLILLVVAAMAHAPAVAVGSLAALAVAELAGLAERRPLPEPEL